VDHGDPVAAAGRVANEAVRGVHGALVEAPDVYHMAFDIQVHVEAGDQAIVEEPADQGVVVLTVLRGEAEDSVKVNTQADLRLDHTEAQRVCALLGSLRVDKACDI
jgi:hypothetical protein